MIDIPDSFFPKDTAGNFLCPKCKKFIAQCNCPVIASTFVKQPKTIPKVRLEKSGRKGKIVTVIEQLLPQEIYLKDLAKRIKTKTGSGGTYYIVDGQGVVEIQGDHLQMVREILTV